MLQNVILLKTNINHVNRDEIDIDLSIVYAKVFHTFHRSAATKFFHRAPFGCGVGVKTTRLI